MSRGRVLWKKNGRSSVLGTIGEINGKIEELPICHSSRSFSRLPDLLETICNVENKSARLHHHDPGLGGFCAVCRYRGFCRGGCTWTAVGHTGDRRDNPYCFYRQAVAHQRGDLLDEDPTADEVAFFARR